MRAQIGLWWALFMASVKMFVRNRTALFFSLFLPLIIMLIFGVLNFEGATTIDLGVVDEAGTDASAAFIDGLREYDYLELTTGDREAELAALEEGDRGFVLVIPSDFEPSLGGETGLVAYASTSDPSQAQVAQGLLQQAVAGALVAASGQPVPAADGVHRAGDLRVGRVARPRLHRLPRARHRRHDRHAARAVRRRLRVRPAEAHRRPAAAVRHPDLARLLPVRPGGQPHGARLRPGRHPHRHRHLVRAADVRLLAGAGSHRRARAPDLPGGRLRRRGLGKERGPGGAGREPHQPADAVPVGRLLPSRCHARGAPDHHPIHAAHLCQRGAARGDQRGRRPGRPRSAAARHGRLGGHHVRDRRPTLQWE